MSFRVWAWVLQRKAWLLSCPLTGFAAQRVSAQCYLWCVPLVAKFCVCTRLRGLLYALYGKGKGDFGLGWFIAMVLISRDNWIYWKFIIKDSAKIWWLRSWSGLLFEFHPRNHNVIVTLPVSCCIWKSCMESCPFSFIFLSVNVVLVSRGLGQGWRGDCNYDDELQTPNVEICMRSFCPGVFLCDVQLKWTVLLSMRQCWRLGAQNDRCKCRIRKHPGVDSSRDYAVWESDLTVDLYSDPSRDERRRGQRVIRLLLLE